MIPAKVMPVRAGERISIMINTVMMKSEPLTNIDTFVPSVS